MSWQEDEDAQDLAHELDEGQYAAQLLVEHVAAMGASAARIPVVGNLGDWVVTVSRVPPSPSDREAGRTPQSIT